MVGVCRGGERFLSLLVLIGPANMNLNFSDSRHSLVRVFFCKTSSLCTRGPIVFVNAGVFQHASTVEIG